MYRKPRWPAIAGGYGVFLLALSALTAFIYENTAPLNRPIVIRLAVVFVLGITLVHLRRYSRGNLLWDPPSDFDRALSLQGPPVKLHAEFAKLRDEVSGAMARRSNFDRSLWPRLVNLARTRGGGPDAIEATSLPNRRGLSPRQIADLIAPIEGLK